MDTHQKNLESLVEQRNNVMQELDKMQNQLNLKKEQFLKIQGAIEYLTQIGISLPEPEPSSNSEEQVEEGLTPAEI